MSIIKKVRPKKGIVSSYLHMELLAVIAMYFLATGIFNGEELKGQSFLAV